MKRRVHPNLREVAKEYSIEDVVLSDKPYCNESMIALAGKEIDVYRYDGSVLYDYRDIEYDWCWLEEWLVPTTNHTEGGELL